MPDLPQKPRFGECTKFAPVAFVTFVICTLYSITMYCHCLPGLRSGEHKTRELAKVIFFHLVTGLLVVCYLRSILTHPGSIPDDDPHWEFVPSDHRQDRDHQQGHVAAMPSMQETKRSGNRRNCKWCNKYKPDRAHHCRICSMCILKMDHHCPWIYNCVGFKNYKYFFLLLFYAAVDLWFCVANLTQSVKDCVLLPDTPFLRMFLCLFGWTLAVFLGVLATAFWCFHIWLASRAMTTVEFCEKHLPKKRGGGGPKHTYNSSVYHLGAWGNLKATLGEHVCVMLLPICPPHGSGLDFVSPDMRLTKDIEKSEGLRRLGHQVVQRPAKPPWGLPVLSESDGLETSTEASLEDGLLAAEPPFPEVLIAAPPRSAPPSRHDVAKMNRDGGGEPMADTGK